MEFKQYPHIETGIISKLYFKKYPYKVTFLGRYITSTAYKRNYGDSINKWLAKQFPSSVKSSGWRHHSARKGEGFRTNFGGYVDSIYFVDKKHVKAFVKEFFKIITWVDSPINQQQLDEQLEDANLLARKNLFENKYRYRIYFKRVTQWDSHYTKRVPIIGGEIDEWFEKYKTKSKNSSKLEHKYYTNWRSSVVLLKHKKDVILVRLALAEYIKRIEVAKLIDEFEENDDGVDIVKSITK